MKNFSEFGESQEQETATGQPRAKAEDVAWLAGIIDGEGHIGISPRGRKGKVMGPILYVGNTSLSLLMKTQRILGEIVGSEPKLAFQRAKTKHKIFRVALYKQKLVLLALHAVLPYLTAKKAQAEEVAEFLIGRMTRSKYHTPHTEQEKGVVQRLKDMRKAEMIPNPLFNPGVENKREAPNADDLN